jgi:2-oxo-4-hydroxy-4-carboxy--5-ureidoimidazoline (OHCU) decarboxylase
VDIAGVNGMDKAAFVAAFGGIFEHSPWVAERAYDRRPFASPAEWHAAMADAVRAERHGFPFIVAVRHCTKAGIFHEFERRIAIDTPSEHAWALSQVFAITPMSIDARFASP